MTTHCIGTTSSFRGEGRREGVSEGGREGEGREGGSREGERELQKVTTL